MYDNIRMSNSKNYKKEIIKENVGVNHLLRSLPFPSKDRLCTIRKGALFDTLKKHMAPVRKSHSLIKLLDLAKDVFHYDKSLEILNKRISIFQNIFKKYLLNIDLRLQGPGIPVNRCINEECPYTMDALNELPLENVITWRDDKIYGCHVQPIYDLFSKALESNGVLNESREKWYEEFIREYIETPSRRRHTLRKITNPFTRQPLPGELFLRLLKIGQRRGLMSNQQIVHEEYVDVMEASNEVSEYIRHLDFYTPTTILGDIIQPVYEHINTPRSSSRAINIAHSIRIHEHITRACIPFLEHLANHFTNPIIRNYIRRSEYSEFYRSFRHGYCNITLREHSDRIDRIIRSPELVLTIGSQVRRLSVALISIWNDVMQILNYLFQLDRIDIDNKRNIAISIIISLVNSGHLRDGFEWAIDT